MYRAMSQTLLRFVGRQPLCGIGVTSRIDFTSMPTVCSARIADSRPEPGPLTRTSSRAQPVGLGGVAGVDRGLGRRERRPLARPLEADAAGARPRDHVAFCVGDRDVRVVERGVNVHVAMMDDALLAALLERLRAASSPLRFSSRRRQALLRQFLPSVALLRPSSSSRSRPCAGPCACARSCACAARAPAGSGDAAARGSSRFPSAA